jgi:zinc D-Ala-D-Ala dipeptidase
MRDTTARSAHGLGGRGGTGEADSLPLARGLLSFGRAQCRAASPEPPVLLSDPRVCAVPVRDAGESLTELDESFGHSRALVRASVARRLALARDELPRGTGLRVVAGHRTAAAQRAIISSYAAGLRIAHPAIGAAELERLTSRFVAPLAVAPHVAGAAADVTLVDNAGRDAR